MNHRRTAHRTAAPYRRYFSLALLFLSVTHSLLAQDSLTTAPSLEQRVAGLEAYLNNANPSPGGHALPSSGIAGPGHNGWMMTSAALVLFMTLPGLALFYGGLVRRKNVLSVLAQCLGIAGLVTILWWSVGYSLVFSDGGNAFLGGWNHLFLSGVGPAPDTSYAYWVSENIFAIYQMMFAIITPALIVGAIAERMKYSAVLLFVTAWMFLVYFPLAHMVWGANGLMNGVWNADAAVRSIDFAGGTVVHMSSGWSALVLCLILGKRIGFGREPMLPHNMVLVMVGTGMLWVGWYGFNAGSALAADGIAANAFVTTTLAAAVASFVWPMAEWAVRGKPSVLGFCSGVVSGLVVITPACGFVDVNGAVGIGVVAGLVPFLAVWKLKAWLGYDDALDTFGVHGVGGTLGAIVTGLAASPSVNPNLSAANAAAQANGLAGLALNGGLVLEQLKAAGLTLLLSVAATVLIAYAVRAFIGLRPSASSELTGLDIAEHGEEGYTGAH